MRIGIVTTWFERGAAMVSRAYRDVLVEQGHDVFIYARGGEHYGRHDPAWDKSYVTWGEPTWGAAMTNVAWRDFLRWVRRERLDAILFNEQNYWPVVVKARRELPVLLAAYVDYYTADTVPFFGLYDVLLCNTQRHHGVFLWHPNSWHIPWGTDLNLFQGHEEPVDPGTIVFFHSAGMNPHRKGTLLALQALRLLPDAKCRFIVHMQTSLDEHPDIRQLCDRDPRIEVENRTVTAPGLYHRGDVLVYPTVLDGLGLTVPEALASGLPTITTDCPPMNEFVSAGETGWLVTPREYRGRPDGYYWAESWCDAAGVADAMAHALAQTASIGQWKRRARKYAEEKLDWRRNAQGLGRRLADAATAKMSGCLATAADRSLESRALLYSPVPPLRLAMRAACRWLGREDSAIGERLIHG